MSMVKLSKNIFKKQLKIHGYNLLRPGNIIYETGVGTFYFSFIFSFFIANDLGPELQCLLRIKEDLKLSTDFSGCEK